MVVTALLALASYEPLPPARDFAFTGTPYLAGAAAASIAVPTHSATIELVDPRTARVSSITQFKNLTGVEQKASLQVPWKVSGSVSPNGASFRTLKVAWNGRDLPMMSTMIYPPTGASAEVVLPPNATASVRVSLEAPVRRTGLGNKQFIVGYALTGDRPVGKLNLTYRYVGNLTGRDVFRLPEAFPKSFPWTIGDRGTFLRLEDVRPSEAVTYLTFYPGGYSDIGD